MIAAALEDHDWFPDAIATIIALSHAQPIFTSDDVRRELRPAPHSNHYGLAFTQAQRAGHIEWVRYVKSTNKTRRGGSVSEWRRKTEGVTP